MSDEALVGIALLIAIFVGVLTYKRRKAGSSKGRKFIERAERAGHFTKAVAVDVKTHYPDRSSSDLELRYPRVTVIYQFTLNGEQQRKGMTYQSPGKVSTDYPREVKVYYDPSNPRKAYFKEELYQGTDNVSSSRRAVGAALLTMIGVFCILKFIIG